MNTWTPYAYVSGYTGSKVDILVETQMILQLHTYINTSP